MKKYLLTALFMLSLAGFASASGQQRASPRGEQNALATADYGGIDYATSAFSAAMTTACNTSGDGNVGWCQGVFYGLWFTSGSVTAMDFVDVFDSTFTPSTLGLQNVQVARLYNIFGATNTLVAANQNTASGFSGVPRPIRFNQGLMIKASVATYNIITILYYKEP